MKKESIYCDYCGKKTTEEGVEKEKLHGFCIEIGYSTNGWGKRSDFIPKENVEICTECFNEISASVEKLKYAISLRKTKSK